MAPLRGPQGDCRVASSGAASALVVQARYRESARKLRELGHAGEERVGKGFPGLQGPLEAAAQGTQHFYILGRRPGWDPRAVMRTQKCQSAQGPQSAGRRS